MLGFEFSCDTIGCVFGYTLQDRLNGAYIHSCWEPLSIETTAVRRSDFLVPGPVEMSFVH
jgi:hypothetical protein